MTRVIATRYRRADKAGKGLILDELCATTGWHRNHARKALAGALTPKLVRPRQPRTPRYGNDVVAALALCWAVLGAPTGKRLAPIMAELVPTLRRFDELVITDEVACGLIAMSPATMDRRLLGAVGRRGAGFVEIDLVGHEGGNAVGDHCYTFTVTDIATGWTENRSVRDKARRWVIAALEEIAKVMPFPIIGVDSDNGSEFINHHLLDWCTQRQVTFTRSRPGNSNDGAHIEQKTWAVVRTAVGYHRYDTAEELLLLNKIWVLQLLMTNYFYPQPLLVSKVRDGAKVIKKSGRRSGTLTTR